LVLGFCALPQACGGSEFKDDEGDDEGDGTAGETSGTNNGGSSGNSGKGGDTSGGGEGGADGVGGDGVSGGATGNGGAGATTGGSGGDTTTGGNPSGGTDAGNGGTGAATGGAGATSGGTGGAPRGGSGGTLGGSGGSMGGTAGGPVYADVQLISSCSGPRGEVYDGAWYAGVGPSSTLSPAFAEGAFPMVSGGYIGSAARIYGTMANGDYAHIGHNMYRGASLFNASAYDGISFFAKAAAPVNVQIGLGQQNNEPTYGQCTPDVTCYKYPGVTINVGTAWTRYVVLFSAMMTEPPGIVPTTPGTLKHIQFSMSAGTYDFYVDELYFVSGP
jgi:hypothetical protein